jgi:hypothetical protein
MILAFVSAELLRRAAITRLAAAFTVRMIQGRTLLTSETARPQIRVLDQRMRFVPVPLVQTEFCS